MLTVDLDLDALAVHVVNTARTRPVAYRADSDGTPLAVELPDPGVLAEAVALPGVECFRAGSALLTRLEGSEEKPTPVDLADLVAALHTALAALPERPGCGRAYRDLRLAVSASGERWRKYLTGAARAFVRTRQSVPTAPRTQRAPGRTPAEWQAAWRERARLDEAATALLWVWLWLADEEERPEDGLTGAELWALCVEQIAAQVAEAEEDDDAAEILLDPDGARRKMREPRRRVFLAVADAVIGPRLAYTRRGRVYALTATAVANAGRALDEIEADPAMLFERAAEILASA